MNKNYFFLGLGVVALLGVGLIVAAFGQRQNQSQTTGSKTVSYTKDGLSQTLELKYVGNNGIEGARYVTGSSSAKNTVVEFADYQCPACGIFATEFEGEFKSKFVETGKVRYAYRDFPLPQHELAPLAARVAACAAEQNGFEALKAMLYRAQSQWSGLSQNLAKQRFLELVGYAGLDKGRTAMCLEQNDFAAAIAKDVEMGRTVQLEATPSFVVNGYLVSGALLPEAFAAILAEVGE
jgi:protein-disulfide isomerase